MIPRDRAGPTDFLPGTLVAFLLAPLTAPDKNALSFVRQRLPWVIGGAGLLVYLVTLNHWISLSSLGMVARTEGWLWQPGVGRPLTLALCFPFHLLPAAWLPLALNLFTAALAALVLTQLARSVTLLRYNVASDDPMQQGKPVLARLTTPSAWMPPVLAALVCGLQLTFWESATAATGEMISLLCFAYALRCLLEFQASDQPAWLYRCVAVYAAGMADNWLLVGYAPLLLVTLVWSKGFGPFLQPRFLLPLLGWGLVGLSAYLLVPVWSGLASEQPTQFGTVLLEHVRLQKQILGAFRAPALRLAVLTALLPALLFAMRWRSHTVQFGDDTPVGIFLVKATGHGVHGLFLLASLWIALNPAFSSRGMEQGLALSPYYYVWALVTGYGAGYFLWLKTHRPPRRPSKLPVYGLAVIIGVMSLLLLWKNAGHVWLGNRSALRQFARQTCDDLPAGKSVVLTEDPLQLLLVRAELAARGRDQDVLLVETPALVLPRYHQFMARRQAARWPDVLSTNRTASVGPSQLLSLVSQLAAREPVFYLHPSSGFFLETFSAESHGSLYRLVPRAGEEAMDPALPEPAFATQQQFWQQLWTNQLAARAEQFARTRRNSDRWSASLGKRLRLAKSPNATGAFLGAAYSKSLNHWGVQARQAGHDPEATEWFRRALALNPDNLAARINLAYAVRCQQGDRSRLSLEWTRQEFPELWEHYDRWLEVPSRNGPVDEPTFLLLTARSLLAARCPRQAAEGFARCAALSPDWVAPRLWLAQSYNLARNFDAALKLTDAIEPARSGLKAPALAQLLLCRTLSLRGLGRTNEAAAYLGQFVAGHHAHSAVLNTAATLHAADGQFTQELELRELLLQHDPGNSEWRLKKGLAELRLTRYDPAIATFTQVLAVAPDDRNARLLRAVANLGAGRLEAAKADYRELLKRPDTSQRALFGLGGIAWREQDTNAVITYYQQFLSNSAALSPQFNLATERLRQLSEE